MKPVSDHETTYGQPFVKPTMSPTVKNGLKFDIVFVLLVYFDDNFLLIEWEKMESLFAKSRNFMQKIVHEK